jgi:predicted polyphosphate/ATP-dependent NAD kinase
MTIRIGFLINPVAGMGGRVGLKGTDEVVDEAVALGAQPIAQMRAGEALMEVRRQLQNALMKVDIEWITCSREMGADCLRTAGFDEVDVVYSPAQPSSREDTVEAARHFAGKECDLILFCGGDGTARDICSTVGMDIPILGIPSGVKMYSGVFGTSPARTAEILLAFAEGRLDTAQVDVLDLDEERYRKGEWAVKLYHSALTPYEPSFSQAAKMLIAEASDAAVKEEIAGFLCESIESRPDVLFLLGPGSTVQSIGHALGIEKTLLGIDAVAGGKLVGKDLNESQILDLLNKYNSCELVLSPIGAQGFVLGRGNLQLSPEVVRKIGTDNIRVVATPPKLARTPVLRFDTGDTDLDAALAERRYWPVIIGYRRRRLVRSMI